MSKIKVLIAEDTETVATILKFVLEMDEGVAVVGVATNGQEAVSMARELRPDVITMDIHMPIMNGLEAIDQIMSTQPLPIIVVSADISSAESIESFDALDKGAVAVMGKPPSITSAQFDDYCRALVSSVKAMKDIRLVKRSRIARKQSEVISPRVQAGQYEVIGVGASTGGPHALHVVLSRLADNYPAPIVVVQHITPGFLDGLVSWMDSNVALKVKQAVDDELLKSGVVYFCPDERHIKIRRNSYGKLYISLEEGVPINGFIPSIDPLLESLADVTPGRSVGVLLTGMGVDGASGLLNMKNAKCLTLVQDKASSVVFGMAQAALDVNAVEQALSLEEFGPYLNLLIERKE